MTIHASARVMERFHIRTADKITSSDAPYARETLVRDADDALSHWSMDLFRCLGKDCLVLMNCISKLSLFLFDVRPSHFDTLGAYISYHLFQLYAGDPVITNYLLRMFREHEYIVFAPLKKRSMTVPLNRLIRDYALRDNRFSGYIDYRHTLHVRQIIHDANYGQTFTRVENGEEIQFQPAVYFRELLAERYGNMPEPK